MALVNVVLSSRGWHRTAYSVSVSLPTSFIRWLFLSDG